MLVLLAIEAPAISISAASFEQDTGFVNFQLDPDIDLNWRSFAENKFASHSLDRPSKQTLESLWRKRDMFDGTERRFDYAPPPVLANEYHYLISSLGTYPLRIARLRGAIAYSFVHEKPALISVTYHGSVLALAPKRIGLTGGFVLSSLRPLRIDTSPVPLDAITVVLAGNALRVTYLDGDRPLIGDTEVITQSRAPKTAKLFRLKPGSQSFLFIQWMPDESSCEFAFSLFLVDAGGLKSVRWTAYNCDV